MSRKGCPLATAEVDEEAERRGIAGVELSEAGAVPGLLVLLWVGENFGWEMSKEGFGYRVGHLAFSWSREWL